MHDGAKIALLTGALGAVVGLGLQSSNDQLTQTIGQGWMLGGVASIALLGGIAAVSAKWQSFKAERQINETIERLEKATTSSLNSDETALKFFVGVTRQSATFFENASEAKKLHVASRLQALGASIADKMPNPEQVDAAAKLVYKVMDYASFKMSVSLDQDAPVRKANIDVDISSPASPAMG